MSFMSIELPSTPDILKYCFVLQKLSFKKHNSRQSLNKVEKKKSHYLQAEPYSPHPPDLPLLWFLFLRSQALGELDT